MSSGKEQKPSFILLVLLAAVVLLLFQLAGMSLGMFSSDYEVNKYAGLALPDRKVIITRGSIALIAPCDESIPCAADACAYLHRGYQRYDAVCEEALYAECIIIAKPEWALENELPLLKRYCERGGTLIVAQLPQTEQIDQSDELRALLGIGGILNAAQTTKGTRYYQHFLLGGNATYDELIDTIPHFWLEAGYKILAAGLTDKPDNYKAGTVPLIWRTRTDNAYVYLVNCDALTRRSGLGILYALLTDAGQNALYPVINAQAALVENFPYLANENTDLLTQRYHQSSSKLLMNTLLPEVTATLSTSGFPLNGAFAASLDGSITNEDKSWEQLTLYIQLIVGRSGEMAASAYSRDPAMAGEKLLRDLEQLRQRARGYTITALSAANLEKAELLQLLRSDKRLENIRTIVTPRTESGDVDAYAYLDEKRMQLPVLMNGFAITQRDRLALSSMETALLSSVFSVDMSRVLYPQSEADDWVRLSKVWSDDVSAAYYPFHKLERLTLTQTDARTRQFLNMDYEVDEQDGTYILRSDVQGTSAYFLLRVPGRKVERVTGGSFTRVEDGAYLITVQAPEVEIVTRAEHEMLYQ